MKRAVLTTLLLSLCVAYSVEAFTIKDGEGNKVKVSALGVQVSTSDGDKVNISPVGVKVASGSGDKVSISPAGVKVASGSGDKVDVTLSGVEIVEGDNKATSKTGVVLKGEHEVVMEARRSSMQFDEVEVSRAIRLTIEERTTGNIIIRAPRSVMPYVSLSVKGGTLYATLLSGAPIARTSNVVAEVYIPNNGRIKELSASASARIIVEPELLGEELELNASSASAIEVKSRTREISIEASGASFVKAAVAISELDIDLSGASKVEASGSSSQTEVEVSGASTAQMGGLKSGNMTAEVSGASKAIFDCINNAKISASSASKVDVHCNGTLTLQASSASTIGYEGNCKVNITSKTGASSIRKK